MLTVSLLDEIHEQTGILLYLCKVGKLPLLNYVYVTVLYTDLTISNEEMCYSHLHIHDIVHKV